MATIRTLVGYPKVLDSTGNMAVKHLADSDEFSHGFIVGLLLGEGQFGGDGRQAQIALKMHIRHERTFRWLEDVLPGGWLDSPYEHDGRRYFQWMARGPFLRNVLVPLVQRHLHRLDDHVAGRFLAMCERYGLGTE